MRQRSSITALQPGNLMQRFQRLSKSHKFIVIVFLIWLVQALPKWTAAITADGELSARIMTSFITPRYESEFKSASTDKDDVAFIGAQREKSTRQGHH